MFDHMFEHVTCGQTQIKTCDHMFAYLTRAYTHMRGRVGVCIHASIHECMLCLFHACTYIRPHVLAVMYVCMYWFVRV